MSISGAIGLSVFSLVSFSAAPAVAQNIYVPSGQPVQFQEFLTAAPGDGLTYRFRFVAPGLAARDSVDPVKTEADMAHLCQFFAIPKLANTGPRPNRIVISLADRETEFGMANPDATQVFESYSLDGEACIWEAF